MLSLAAATTLDAGAAGTIDAARSTGFDAFGLRPTPAELDDRTARELARRANDSGLAVLDVEVVRLGADAQVIEPRRLLDFAARLRARFVLVVSHFVDPSRTADEMARLCDLATGHGLRIALEFMRFTEVPTLAAALSVLDRTGKENAGVLVDALHLQRSGGAPADLRAVPSGRLTYVQLCDGPVNGPTELAGLADEARHRRLPPGAGSLPLVELMAELDDAVPVSVEVQSDRLARDLPPAARARLVLDHARAVLGHGL